MKWTDFIDIADLKALPSEFAGSFKPSNIIAKGYPMWTPKGDTGPFFALFFDCLATQLSLAGMAVGVLGFDASFVYTHFMGGVGLSIFFGNLYYCLQASKVAMRTGKMDTCAQPYGVNTPGAIAKTFGILGVVLMKETANGVDKESAMRAAWSTACCANFLGGLFEFLGAFIAPVIARNCPQGAFLAPIGGIGMTWLGINQIISLLAGHKSHNPIVGFLPFVLVWINGFGTDKLFGPVPTLLVAAVLGIVLNLLARTGDWDTFAEQVSSSTDHLGWNGLAVPDLSYMGKAWEEYGSLVLGLACTNFIGTYACNISARKGGDFFSPMESMLIDGLGSMLGALYALRFSPHLHSNNAVWAGDSLANGVLWLLFGLVGMHSLVDAIVPHEIVSPVIVCIGFSMAAQTVAVVPQRWYPAVLVGLGICFSEYMINSGVSNVDFKILGNGYVFVSFFFTFLLMMLTDRWFLGAFGVAILLMLAATCGLIHANKLSLSYTSEGTLVGSEDMASALSDGYPGWKFVNAYGCAAAMLLALHLLQRRGLIEAPETEDFRDIQAKELASSAEPGDEHDKLKFNANV